MTSPPSPAGIRIADYQVTTDGEILQQVSLRDAGLALLVSGWWHRARFSGGPAAVLELPGLGSADLPTCRPGGYAIRVPGGSFKRGQNSQAEQRRSSRIPGKGQEVMGYGKGGHDALESGEQFGLAGVALADLFERFDRGNNYWHAPIQRLLDGLTAEQALWRPAPGRHCIWQIVRHMNFWRQYVIAQLEEAPLPDPQTGDWSNPPALDEPSWKAEREEYNRTQARLLEVVRSLTGSQLAGAVGEEEGETRLYHWVAGLLAHDSYHAGQIAYLRAMQGIPVA